MKPNSLTGVNLTIAVIVVLASVQVLELLESRRFYDWQQRRMVKRVLAANPEDLLSAGRQLLNSRSGYVGEISSSSHDIPNIIRRLKPTRISFTTNSVSVDFSDEFNPFGIVAFIAGTDGRGTRKWIDGLWLYDDGQLEGLGPQDGAANGSQPFRADTNRTSRTGGSRR